MHTVQHAALHLPKSSNVSEATKLPEVMLAVSDGTSRRSSSGASFPYGGDAEIGGGAYRHVLPPGYASGQEGVLTIYEGRSHP